MNLARSTSSHNEFGEDDIRDIVIRSYTNVGTVSGMGQSTVEVEAREAIVPDRHLVDYSVRFELSTGGDYPQTGFTSVSFDDVDRLVVMLKKLETTSIATDRFAFSEVQFEIGELRITVFNTSHGSIMASVSTGGISVHLTSLAKLSSLTSLIERAKSYLDEHRRIK